jgi:Sulfotransferase family
MASAANSPIFIIGCHRSGTTLLRLILDAHPNISCGPETRFLADLANITADPNWQRMRLYGFPKQYWHQRIATLFDAFQSEYAHARGKVRWADKTPRYALCVDYLNELFPTCQVVHVVRDGRDVVASHRDRWGYGSALKAVKKWPWYVATARAAGARLPADRYHEVRYEDLVTDPEGTLRQLLDFLGEPWDPILLDHDQRPHDVPERYLAFSSSRRTATARQPAIYRSRVGAGRRELDPLLRLLVTLHARRTLRELGYR